MDLTFLKEKFFVFRNLTRDFSWIYDGLAADVKKDKKKIYCKIKFVEQINIEKKLIALSSVFILIDKRPGLYKL